MKISKLFFGALLVVQMVNTSLAGRIFESGTLGQTGITKDDVIFGQPEVPGTNVASFVWTGARFQVTKPSVTSRLGGHFVGGFSLDSYFGAIVRLSGADDFPDSDDLTTPDVLGHTTLTFPDPSDEVFADLVLRLDPGWHAIVFGSGLFGTNGRGIAIRNGVDHSGQSYFGAHESGGGYDWYELPSPSFDNHRFVVEGYAVPEPASLLLAIVAAASLALVSRRRIATPEKDS